MIVQADARHLTSVFSKASAQCAVFSPPYFGLRRYGDDPDEIGADSLDQWVQDMVLSCRQLEEVLDDEAVMWINVDDTASGSGGAGGDYNSGGSKEGKRKYKQGKSGLPRMTWCSAPARLQIALQSDGWLLRSHIIWDKETVRRGETVESHYRRPGRSYEDIFMFVKQRKYRWYPGNLVEPGDVWHFPPTPSGKTNGHVAPFPDELPRRCILPTTLEGDTVIDCFAGSGTTLRVANELGRIGIGSDLYV